MGGFRLTRLAEADLRDIGEYTLRNWSKTQAIRYINELELACERLASSPLSGRPCNHFRPGLYRCEAGKHVLFYRRVGGAIVIVRILHQQMQPARHSFREERERND